MSSSHALDHLPEDAERVDGVIELQAQTVESCTNGQKRLNPVESGLSRFRAWNDVVGANEIDVTDAAARDPTGRALLLVAGNVDRPNVVTQ